MALLAIQALKMLDVKSQEISDELICKSWGHQTLVSLPLVMSWTFRTRDVDVRALKMQLERFELDGLVGCTELW